MIRAIITYITSKFNYTNGNVIDSYVLEVERSQHENREKAAKEALLHVAVDRVDMYENQ